MVRGKKRGYEIFVMLAFGMMLFILPEIEAGYCTNPDPDLRGLYCQAGVSATDCCRGQASCAEYFETKPADLCVEGCCYIPTDKLKSCVGGDYSYQGLCDYYREGSGEFVADPGCQGITECQTGCCCYKNQDNTDAYALKSKAFCEDPQITKSGIFHPELKTDSGCKTECGIGSINPVEGKTACSDGIDNDGDLLIDLYDPGCQGFSDSSERPSSSQCIDGIDNDNDGKIDEYDVCCQNNVNSYSESLCKLGQLAFGEQCAQNKGCNCNDVSLCQEGQYCCPTGCQDTPCTSSCIEGDRQYIREQDGCAIYKYCYMGAWSPEIKDPYCGSMDYEKCDDNIDNNKDGLVDCQDPRCNRVVCKSGTDVPGAGSFCQSKGYRDVFNANLVKCCYGLPTNDCYDNDGIVDTCGKCSCELNPIKPIMIGVTKVPGDDKLSVRWTLGCNVSFNVYKCTVSSTNNCTQKTSGFSLVHNIYAEEYIDQAEAGKKFCYYVQANYPGTGSPTISDAISCSGQLNSMCMDKDPGQEFCLDEGLETDGRRVFRVSCDSSGNLLPIQRCDEGEMNQMKVCLGPDSSGRTRCVFQNPCEECGSPFNMFTDFNTAVTSTEAGTGSQIQCRSLDACYFDRTDTTIDAFRECAQVASCYDYRSKSACQGQAKASYNNKCLLRNCEWVPIDDELDSGFCSETSDYFKSCGACNTVGSHSQVFGACTVEKCAMFGKEGSKCYLSQTMLDESQNRICTDEDDIVCEDYLSRDECEGIPNQAVVVDVGYQQNSQSIRVSGTNRITTPSSDPLGIGLCKWIVNMNHPGGKCFKDADGNNGGDGSPFDVTPPVTMLLSEGKVKTLNIDAQVIDPAVSAKGKSGVSGFFYCLDEEDCYPDKQLAPVNGMIFKELGMSSGPHILRYYSADISGNLEVVREAVIDVDRFGPKITITYSIERDTTYPHDSSKANIQVQLDEEATCYDQMEKVQSKEIVGIKGEYFQPIYSGLSDGFYIYNVTCIDEAGNIGRAHASIYVDGDSTITNPKPNGVINISNPVLEITTTKPLTCTWQRGGSGQGGFTMQSEGGLYIHRSQYAGITGPGVYEFMITCQDGSKYHRDEIQFVYDNVAPSTRIVDGNGADISFESWFSNEDVDHTIFFSCEDLPVFGFGCRGTYYCTARYPCEPEKFYSERDPIEFELNYDGATWLCYYSVENLDAAKNMGGLEEEKVCSQIKIDRQPPILNVDHLASHTTAQNPLHTRELYFSMTGDVQDPDAPQSPNNKVTVRTSNGPLEKEYVASANPGFALELELALGLNTIIVTAKDRSGTTAANAPQTYYIFQDEFNDSSIVLDSPRNGVSKDPVFDLRVATYMPMQDCRFSFAEDPSLSYDRYVRFDNSDKPLREGNVWYYEKKDRILCIGDIPCESKVFIKCRTAYGNEITAGFNLSWDPTPPKIIDTYIYPHDSFDKNLLSEPPLQINLTVITDDKTRCRHSQSKSSVFPSMTPFSGYGANSFTEINLEPISPDDQKKYTYFIMCENGAGEKTPLKEYNFEVDTTIPGNMRLIVPNGTYSPTTTFRIKLETNKIASSCVYRPKDAQSSSEMTRLTDYMFEAPEAVTLEDQKSYQYVFTCMFIAGPYEKELTITVDTTPPSLPLISSPPVWKFPTSLPANWSSVDNGSGIVAYEYRVGSSISSSDIIRPTLTQKEGVTVQGLNLTLGKKYYWTVRAKNGAGLWSREAYAEVIVDNRSVDYDATGCTNRFSDNEESDVDCGGTVCPKCAAGKRCLIGQDCQSLVCTGGVCQQATCNDSTSNQGESDIDCGGPNCEQCGIGKSCLRGSDCSSGFCGSLGRCEEASCDDNIKNGDEEDVDCGGSCPNECDRVAGACETDDGIDSDCDKMPDSWEIKNKLSVYIDDADEDPDKDGYTNYEEYINGTDPWKSDKAGRWWIWLIIILLLGGLGAGGYYYYSEFYSKGRSIKTIFDKDHGKSHGQPGMGLGMQQQDAQKQYEMMQQQKANALRQQAMERQKQLVQKMSDAARKKRDEEKKQERSSLLSSFDSSGSGKGGRSGTDGKDDQGNGDGILKKLEQRPDVAGKKEAEPPKQKERAGTLDKQFYEKNTPTDTGRTILPGIVVRDREQNDAKPSDAIIPDENPSDENLAQKKTGVKALEDLKTFARKKDDIGKASQDETSKTALPQDGMAAKEKKPAQVAKEFSDSPDSKTSDKPKPQARSQVTAAAAEGKQDLSQSDVKKGIQQAAKAGNSKTGKDSATKDKSSSKADQAGSEAKAQARTSADISKKTQGDQAARQTQKNAKRGKALDSLRGFAADEPKDRVFSELTGIAGKNKKAFPKKAQKSGKTK